VKPTDLPEYSVWTTMKTRCNNSNAWNFKYYGGRGIRVCERWETFENFYADMGPRPSPKHELERFKNDIGYEPGNCGWDTHKNQTRNRGNKVTVDFRGQTMLLIEACELMGVKIGPVYVRLRLGWSLEDALSIPLRAKVPNGCGLRGKNKQK